MVTDDHPYSFPNPANNNPEESQKDDSAHTDVTFLARETFRHSFNGWGMKHLSHWKRNIQMDFLTRWMEHASRQYIYGKY